MSPHYNGTTTAERFTDDMAAHRACKRHEIEQEVFLLPNIVRRYPPLRIELDDDGLPSFIWFMDNSAVTRNARGRWEITS